MGSHGFLMFLLPISLGLMCTCKGHDFLVGGKDGWLKNPSESYNHWAGRNRFQVNDSLVFRYEEGDSVLVVSNEDYESCTVNNTINRFSNGSTVFKLDRSGPFFFISGKKNRCEKGQKMIVVVMAVRGKHTPPPTSPCPPAAPSQAPHSTYGSPSSKPHTPKASSASPYLFSWTSSGVSLAVAMAMAMAVVFGCFLGPF